MIGGCKHVLNASEEIARDDRFVQSLMQLSQTWTFQTVDGTNLRSFRVTIRSQQAWLPITTTVTSAITPSNQPPARISTQGDYPSPRGCTGTLLSVGNAETRTIDDRHDDAQTQVRREAGQARPVAAAASRSPTRALTREWRRRSLSPSTQRPDG